MITFRERAFDYVQKLFLFTFHLAHLECSISGRHTSIKSCLHQLDLLLWILLFFVVVDVFIPHSIRCSAHFSRKTILFSMLNWRCCAATLRNVARHCWIQMFFFSLLFIAFSSLTFAVLIQSIASRWSCKRRASFSDIINNKFELSVFIIGKLFIATRSVWAIHDNSLVIM